LCKVINKGYGTKNSELLILPEQDSVTTSQYVAGGMRVVVIPSTVKTIGTGAFGNCTNLVSVMFPYGLKTIDAGAFLGSSSLKILKLPRSVTNIGVSAFPVQAEHIYVPWSEGDVEGAPWGASNAVIHYNHV
jgi:hypothetical protein